jgi:hypothetical protein
MDKKLLQKTARWQAADSNGVVTFATKAARQGAAVFNRRWGDCKSPFLE